MEWRFSSKQSQIQQPDLILLGKDKIIIPDVNTHPSLALAFDSKRKKRREQLKDTVQEIFSSVPLKPNEQVVYLAARGQEFRSLYSDTSDIRKRNAQWGIIEMLAEAGDCRFDSKHSGHDTKLHDSLHNQIWKEYPKVWDSLNEVWNSIKDVSRRYPLKEKVTNGLLERFPYFDDVLAAAVYEGGIDEQNRNSLELLYVENRVEKMYSWLKEDIGNEDPRRFSAYQSHILERFGSKIDSNGNKFEGKLEKALRRHEQLCSYTLPKVTFIEEALKKDPSQEAVEVFRAS